MLRVELKRVSSRAMSFGMMATVWSRFHKEGDAIWSQEVWVMTIKTLQIFWLSPLGCPCLMHDDP